MLRTLPYVEGLVANYLKETLPAHYPTAKITTAPVEETQRTYPYVRVHCPRFTASRNATLAGNATVDIQCYTQNSKRECADVAETIRNLVFRLFDRGIVRPEGRVTGHEEQAGPAQIPSDDPAAPWRYNALYRLRIRPAD